MPFHGLYHRIPSCYQGSNQFQAQKFHSNDHTYRIWPFSTIFGHFRVKNFGRFSGQTPYAFKIEPWFESVIFYRNVIMTHYAIIIIRDHWKKIVPKKNFGGIQTFFRQIIKLKNHLNKRSLGDNGRKCWYLFWSRRPYFLINFNFSFLASLRIFSFFG